MSYFTPMIDKYFANWILKETWDTLHGSDVDRFYLFVKALSFYSKPVTRGAQSPHI